MRVYTQVEYFSYMFSICALVATGWMLGYNDHQMLKYWYSFIMAILLIIRISDFKKKKYHHFFSEMCYFVNILAMYFFLADYDIKPIYPYLHGPLLLYAIVSGDAFIPHDLSKTTSFALHSFGTIVSRRLYWNGVNTLSLSVLTLESYSYYLKICMSIYFIWFIPYSCYVFWYKGKSLTMIKYTLKLKEEDYVSFLTKIIYLLKHMIVTAISISLGIILMHCNLLDNIMCGLQLCSGIVQGSYYYSNGKKLKIIDLMKTWLQSNNEDLEKVKRF